MTQEHCARRPGPALREAVPLLSGYRERGLPAAQHLGLPSPYLTFIITLDEPCEIAAHPDPAVRPGAYPTLIGGLHTRPAVIVHDGAQSGVQVTLDPLAARAVLGLPAADLVMLDLPAQDVIGPVAEQLQERLRSAPGWPERFAVVEGFVADRVAAAEPAERRTSLRVRDDIRFAWRHLLRRRGQVTVEELAAATGLGVRRFAELFRAELGVSPKTAARLARFDATRRRVPEALTVGRLVDLAPAMGYADQAHLTREFVDFTGLPPRRWWAAESAGFRFLQDS